MKALLLGVGMQGRAALHDLVANPVFDEVIAADRDLAALKAFVADRGYGAKARCEPLDATNPADLDRLFAMGADVAVDLLPVPFIESVAKAAIAHRVHLVNTFYVEPGLAALEHRAKAAGVTILPEFGMDPGIDLVLLGEATRGFDRVEEVISYGAGFPEPKAAAKSPIGYKVTWTFEGVLRSYHRAGRVIRDGRAVDIPADAMFAPEHIHRLTVEGLGELEAFPNGDATSFAERLGLDLSALRHMGRYVLRWPGHCAFWHAVNGLHLLDDGPVNVAGNPVDRQGFLAAAMEPYLQYEPDERDVVVVRVDVLGEAGGARKRRRLEVVDRRDLETGFTAMSRTVGFTAALGASLLAEGVVRGPGILSPLDDIPYDVFAAALRQRGLVVTGREELLTPCGADGV